MTGWTQHSGNFWKAPLNRDNKLRALYVNDRRAQMASKTISTCDVLRVSVAAAAVFQQAAAAFSKRVGTAPSARLAIGARFEGCAKGGQG
ncbi:hypothetical protein [Streptomyces sp. SLBN-31]|uniref:hypothetical protein n=1 Tax=Streptomyces sp. SLBN-31 TaxID=2768444 RepID=UPI0015761C86|nr:hypothetical protein [Streptomyces sp. SLBN-31]